MLVRAKAISQGQLDDALKEQLKARSELWETTF